VNERNGLDTDGLSDYVAWYLASGPDTGDADYSLQVDWNADGTVDPDDLADFIAAYFAGC